jgi:hypothetical protein
VQRITATPTEEVPDGDIDEEELQQKKVQERSMINLFDKKGNKKKKKFTVPEQFKLVQGDPPQARFEFIAVRQTWISDHMPPALLKALTSAETGEPVPDD